ncbi:hypothetical protein BV898_19241 [Hypsibius exemplaris]|uniref:Uncharacterized protein n=1 Tax=Hypsibius exemplaris TaxID=2072580 RepID=A0A9X6NLA7_HYPEX|nr:hypothetical protein BV898_19241 [Hypsibius exemplaris]
MALDSEWRLANRTGILAKYDSQWAGRQSGQLSGRRIVGGSECGSLSGWCIIGGCQGVSFEVVGISFPAGRSADINDSQPE